MMIFSLIVVLILDSFRISNFDLSNCCESPSPAEKGDHRRWWMRRSPSGCISRGLCGFCLVTQGFLCNETRLTKDVKPLKERPPHPPLRGPPSPLGKAYKLQFIFFTQLYHNSIVKSTFQTVFNGFFIFGVLTS